MNITTLLKQISFLLLFLLLSWILIHFLAVFGVFLALALPLLHLVFYPHILCFWCRLKGSKHTFKHSVIDSLLILALTIISIPIVYLEYKLLMQYQKPVEIAQIAQFTIPSKSQHPVGEIFPIPIELMNIPGSINVAQADLSYDPTMIEVVDLTTDGTFVSFFVQKEFDNQKGYVRVSGGIPNPGYRKPTGLLATAYVKGIKPGAVELKYLESSLVLANDGRGTNLLADYPTIPMIIIPSDPTSSPLPKDLTIRNQIQGDKDKTVLSFTEYASDLPKPFADTLGEQDAPIPLPHSTTESDITKLEGSLLLKLDTAILEFWQNILK